MSLVAQVLAALMALTLLVIGALETFFFRNAALYPIFLIEPDEYDVAEVDVERLSNGTVRVSSRFPVDDLEEVLGLPVEDDDVDTVGGLMAKHLGRVPIAGSVVECAGLRFEAEAPLGRRNRIGAVLINRLEPVEEPDEEVEIVSYPPRRSLLELLSERLQGTATAQQLGLAAAVFGAGGLASEGFVFSLRATGGLAAGAASGRS